MTKLFANQTFAIFTSLCESLVLLIKAYHEYYSQISFLPWYHESKPVEHFFDIVYIDAGWNPLIIAEIILKL